MNSYRIIFKYAILFYIIFGLCFQTQGQESPKEEDFFKILKVPAPEGALLEVGGLTLLPDGSLGVATRRGDVFLVKNPISNQPYWTRFGYGLHEILGIAYHEGSMYVVQRGELTKLIDSNSDGQADIYETIASWPLSTHYHEYSFGPKVTPEGNFIVTTNVAFGDQEWWRGEARVPYRGMTLKIHQDGTIEPFASGMRSPAGPGILNGEVFYTENQGDYIASGGLWHLEKGDFSGHPASLAWSELPEVPVKMNTDEFNSVVDPMKIKDANGRYIKPENNVDAPYITLAQAKEKLPEIKLPAVWLPHGVHGISNSEPLMIPDNYWGPFGGQILVGDQGQSKIMRIMLEKVNGVYQGASIDFRSGFQSGVLRMAFAKDQSLFIGETNRGWGSAGDANEGLQRLVWNRIVPFEIRTIKAKPDGFEVEFTKPIDPKSAENLESYSVSSYTYKYFPVYGSPPVDSQAHQILGVEISEDKKKVRIAIENPKKHYVHRLSLPGIRAAGTYHELIHTDAYYTLHEIPTGKPMTIKAPMKEEIIEKAQEKKPTRVIVKPTTSQKSEVPTENEIKALLAKNTCTACHAPDKRVVGPSFQEIAKRNYSPEKIVDLIYNPKPENWPNYSTPMAAMPQVPKDQALKIAHWINSLK